MRLQTVKLQQLLLSSDSNLLQVEINPTATAVNYKKCSALLPSSTLCHLLNFSTTLQYIHNFYFNLYLYYKWFKQNISGELFSRPLIEQGGEIN